MTDTRHTPVKPGFETTDAHSPWVFITGLCLAVGVALIAGGTYLMFTLLHRRDLARQNRTTFDRVTQAVAETRPHYPAPQLQVAPALDLAALRAREDAQLQSYGWVDRKAGTVRLPIAYAMDLLVQRGLPVRGDPNAPKPAVTPLEMQQSRPTQREPIPENPIQEVK
jgi:hypothetical protein